MYVPPLAGGRKRPFKLKIVIRWRPLALFGIAFLGLALRLYGLDWDQIQARSQLLLRLYGADFALGNNFHPDERERFSFMLFNCHGLRAWRNFSIPLLHR